MSKHSIAEVAFKLFGIYLLVQLFSSFSNFVLPSLLGSERIRIGAELAGPLLLVSGAVLLLVNADWLARRLVGPPPEAESVHLDIHELQEVAFSVAGVFIATNAVWGIFSAIRFLRHTPQELIGVEENPEAIDLLIGLAGPALQLALGVALFVGAGTVTEWLRRSRARAQNYNLEEPD